MLYQFLHSLKNEFLHYRSAEVHKLDHQYPGKLAKDKPVVILYGEIGSESLNNFHVKLKALAELGEITYVMRHFLKDRNGPKVRLSGKLSF